MAHRDRYLESGKKYKEQHYDQIQEQRAQYRKEHSEELCAQARDYYAKRKSEGYSYRKDLVTGKYKWVYTRDEEPKQLSDTKAAIRSREHRELMINYGFKRMIDPATGKRSWVYCGLTTRFVFNKNYEIPETIEDPEISIVFDNEKDYHRYYYQTHKAEHAARCKEYRGKHRDEANERNRKYRDRKRAAGYKLTKDPITKKQSWVFVGLPEQEVAA